MIRRILVPIALTLLALPALAADQPPMAKQIPHELTIHGDTRVDPFYWLNQREDPEVIAYLEAENAWTAQQMADTEALQNELFEEIKGRIKQDDSTVPYRWHGQYYYSRYEEGRDYPVYCRRDGSMDADEQVMFDVNEFAEGHEYYYMRWPAVTPDSRIAAFAYDDFGRRKYTIKFKDLTTGEILDEAIELVSGNMVWADDSRTLFYTRKHPTTLRSYQIWRHELGTDPTNDVLVFEETDDTFSVGVSKTKSEEFILIESGHTLRTEIRFLAADDPRGEFTVFLEREGEHDYSVDHAGDHWFIRTNDEAANSRLMKAPTDDFARDSWTEVIAHRDDVLLMGFELFADHLVVLERKDGLRQLRIMPWDGSGDHYLDFGEPTYYAGMSFNPEYDTTTLRYSYQSMTTPSSVFDYDMVARGYTLLKQDEVLGGFSSDDYVTERIWAPARDGRKIPVSLVYRKDIDPRGNNPLVEYAYGSYGSSREAFFSASRLSLLDRGFIWVTAHVRGGQEMGRWWYEEGQLLNKKNTFTDFIDVGQFLVDEGYTSPERLYGYGGSAGGLLIGAVANMAPELYDGLIAAVPFVDVITTMLDESIPLTTGEFDEWGNPKDPVYYEYMLSYSPYDQIGAKDYPNLLVTTGLHDSQVQYWEPAKWVAKLRTLKTDDNQLLLQTNMAAGHGGSSGRFRSYEETAFRWAFFIKLASDSSGAMR
jgi:oligopeptidase B